jgi:hypothetical protein
MIRTTWTEREKESFQLVEWGQITTTVFKVLFYINLASPKKKV